MKKFFKFLGAVTAICAGVAGGLFLYNKYKERQDSFDDDLMMIMMMIFPMMKMQRSVHM